MVLYKNDKKVAENLTVPVQIASTTSYIGRFYTGYYFGGAIDNVMVFNRALTADEITALYNQGNARKKSPAVRRRHLITPMLEYGYGSGYGRKC